MSINLLTIKIVLLLFPGMIGLIIFRFNLYEKRDIKVPEFILYSLIFSLASSLFNFNDLLLFLGNFEKLNLTLNFILLSGLVSSLLGLSLSCLINKGYIHDFLSLSHSGKVPLIEDLYLKNQYHKYLTYYGQIRTSNFVYVGSIETINSKGELTEFLISEVTVYSKDSNNPSSILRELYSRTSIYLSLQNGTFSLEFTN